MASKAFKSLLEHARGLAADLARMEFLGPGEHGERLAELKAEALALLEGKILPELASSLTLPLFVAVLGGTNTGKSTAFNALAGVLLSETKVVAGATKHPLVYVHRKWSEPLLSGRVFDRVRCLELDHAERAVLPADEAQMLFAFHERPELEGTAFVDSPDLDSAEPGNREVAKLVLRQADVCLFITTPQKYKDRVLIEDLAGMARVHKRVLVIFNFVDDEMLYRTMVDDMRRLLDGKVEFGGYLPTIATRQPERALERQVGEIVAKFLAGLSRAEVKLAALREALDTLVERVRALVESHRAEAGRKGEVLETVARQAERARSEYRAGFALAFPELGEALRRRLGALELRNLVPRPKASADKARVLELLYHALGVAGERLSRLFADGFAPGERPADWEAFWKKRDADDRLRILQLAQLERSRVDNALRASAPTSALCLALLREVFTIESLERFEADIEAAHARLAAGEPEIGRALLARTDLARPSRPRPSPNGAERTSVPALALGANALKLMSGLCLAELTGGLGTLDLVFFPLGFVGADFAIGLVLWLLLRRSAVLFRAQRERWFQTALEEVFTQPLSRKVESVASAGDLDELARRCEAIARERP